MLSIFTTSTGVPSAISVPSTERACHTTPSRLIEPESQSITSLAFVTRPIIASLLVGAPVLSSHFSTTGLMANIVIAVPHIPMKISQLYESIKNDAAPAQKKPMPTEPATNDGVKISMMNITTPIINSRVVKSIKSIITNIKS